MRVGQVISDTFGVVKARFGPLLGLWAIYFAITIVLSFVFAIGIGVAGVASFASMAGSDPMAGNPLAASAGIFLAVVLFYVGYLIVMMAQYASMIMLASPLKHLTVGEALGAGWRAAPALVVLMIVMIVGYVAVVLVFGLVGTAFSAMGQWGSALFGLLLVPAFVWLGCRLSLLFAVVAVDGVRNPFTAVARSWNLTKGHALTIFLASLVFIIILIVITGVALLPSIGMLRSMADPAALTDAAAAPAVGGILLFGLGMLVVSVLFNLCYCAFLAAIHGTLAADAGEGAAEAFA